MLDKDVGMCTYSSPMQPTDELLSAQQVADLAGVAVSTVTYWARTGVLDVAFKHAGKTGPRYFTRADVERLLAERTEVAP